MVFHVFANNQQMGPFNKEAVLEMAAMGSIPADASVWHDGAPDWYPLAEFLSAHGGGGAVQSVVPSAGADPAPATVPARRGSVGEGVRDDGPSPTAFVVRGVAAGFGTAVLGGAAWLAFSMFTGFWIGYIGILVGWLVGKATSAASREEGAVILPVSAVLFTVLAFAPVLAMAYLSPWVWLSLAFGCFNAWRAAAQ